MQFDFKVTTWERVTVPEDMEQTILDGLKDGSITCSNDIYELTIGVDLVILDDTTAQMSVAENLGTSTIEVIDDNGKTIFFNEEL